MWLWLVFEKPRCHPTIDVHELKYIEKSLGESVQQSMPTISSTPWRDICRSLPVYAIVVANFCRSWNFYMLVLYQSSYLKHVFNFKVTEVMTRPCFHSIKFCINILLVGWSCWSFTTSYYDYHCAFRWYAS